MTHRLHDVRRELSAPVAQTFPGHTLTGEHYDIRFSKHTDRVVGDCQVHLFDFNNTVAVKSKKIINTETVRAPHNTTNPI